MFSELAEAVDTTQTKENKNTVRKQNIYVNVSKVLSFTLLSD